MAKLDYTKRLKIKNVIVFRSFKILVGISTTKLLLNTLFLLNLYQNIYSMIHTVIQNKTS